MTDNKPKWSNVKTFSKLWRLMRHGSLVATRLKPSFDTKDEVTSYTREFGIQHSNLQLSQWFGNGSNSTYDTNRFSRYTEYAQMDGSVPEISSALNLVADETTSRSEDGKVLFVESNDEAIKKILETLFFDILDIDFYIWGWVRTMCKYGEQVLYFDVHPERGIERIITIPVNDFERVEGTVEDPQEIKFKWISMNKSLENWQVAHLRILGQDKFLPYGTSFIEGARSFWRKLVLMEDAMLVYRVLRAPERRVFYIDVSNVAPANVETFMKQIGEKLRRTKVIDHLTGGIDQRFDPLDVSEDYFIPTRGERLNRIETLPGGQHVNDIEDVEYLLKKLIAALGIPRAYLTYEEDLANKSTLASLDIRFSRTIERIQRAIVSELTKIAMVHLIVNGYEGSDLLNFDLKLTNPSNLASMQKLDLLERRVAVCSGLNNEKLFDRSFVLKKFFNLKNSDIHKINVGRMNDAYVDGQVAYIENQASKQGGIEGGGGPGGGRFGGGGGGGALGTEEELGAGEELGGEAEGGVAPEGEAGGGGGATAAPEIGATPEAGTIGAIQITASNDAFEKAKAKQKKNKEEDETDYEKKIRRRKARNQSGLIDLRNFVNQNDDDSMNDPFEKKTFSRLVRGLESEMATKVTSKKRLLTEIIGDVQNFMNNERNSDSSEVPLIIDKEDK